MAPSDRFCSPSMTSKTAPAAARPATTVTNNMALHLDLGYAAHDEEANDHQDERYAHHGQAAGVVVPKEADVLGVDGIEDERQHQGQHADDVAGRGAVGRQRLDFTLDSHALANGVRDSVQDHRQVAADLSLHVDCHRHDFYVHALDAPYQVGQGLLRREADTHLLDHAVEFGGDRGSHFPGNH